MESQNDSFKTILIELEALDYSDDAILDFINLLEKAISISRDNDSERRTNPCLNNLVQTKEKELDGLLNAKNKTNRQDCFNEAKNNFKMDLRMFCII